MEQGGGSGSRWGGVRARGCWCEGREGGGVLEQEGGSGSRWGVLLEQEGVGVRGGRVGGC